MQSVPARVALRAAHWLLTPGFVRQTPASRMRGWVRVLKWRGADRATRRALVRQAIRRPLDLWYYAGRKVEDSGAEIVAASGVPPATQRRRLWWLALRYGIDDRHFRTFQLYRPDRARRAAAYVQLAEFVAANQLYYASMPRESHDAGVLPDKRRFAAWCAAHGFPAVPTLAEFHDGELLGETAAADAAATLPRGDLFAKPADSTGGHGAARWRYVGDDPSGAPQWAMDSGEPHDAAALLAELARTSATLPGKYGKTPRRILLQPNLRNHRDLLPLTPGALCTLRVVTYRFPSEPGQVLLAAHKFARAGAAGDNTNLGGISAPMDLTTGRLGPANGPDGRVRREYVAHPDTGARIAGTVVPHWREALDLCSRAFAATRGLNSVGWDVAITDDGPVLIEGNTWSNPGIAQAPSGIPLSDTPFPAAINAHLEQILGV